MLEYKNNLTKKRKNLTYGYNFKKGRNSRGIITIRHRGGGHKHLYRKIDFNYNKREISTILTIERDPNRNANICLVYSENLNKYRYILHTQGVNIGNTIISDYNVPVSIGNTLIIKHLSLGTIIHNIGGKIARAAGTAAKLVIKQNKIGILKLPSGKLKTISLNCFGTIGQVSNLKIKNNIFKKAGEKRWIGQRPRVRGLAMNPVDHPHGGGEGKTSIGRKYPLTPWGYPVFGKKRRKCLKLK
uniref:ribosomal protein L2 n=1 Tax=Hydnora esculenta TaxID=1851369 RepID=UPI0021148C33|nr:ribosomal protein L2 [Hydnora esculenta]USN93634.1 ribosomal protein L2 [Hydnora esculenta]